MFAVAAWPLHRLCRTLTLGWAPPGRAEGGAPRGGPQASEPASVPLHTWQAGKHASAEVADLKQRAILLSSEFQRKLGFRGPSRLLPGLRGPRDSHVAHRVPSS